MTEAEKIRIRARAKKRQMESQGGNTEARAEAAGTTPELMTLLSQAPGGAGSGADPNVMDPVQGDPTVVSDVLDNVVGGFRPEMSPGEKLGTALNMGGESMTFGLVGDEALAAVESLIPGVNYEDRLRHYRDNEASLRERAPAAGIAADVLGGVVGAAVPVGAAMQAGRLPARLLKSTLAGGAMGGTYGFMEGEGGLENRVDDAEFGTQIGLGAGAIAPFVGAAAQKAADYLPQRNFIRKALKNASTAAEQRRRSGAQYNAFEEANAQIGLPAVRRIGQGMDDAMRKIEPHPSMPGPLGQPSEGYNAVTRTMRSIGDDMAEGGAMPGNSNPGLPLQRLDDVRKQISRRFAQEVDPVTRRPTRNAASAQASIRAMDDLVANLQPDDIVGGSYETAMSAITKARDAWKTSMKTETLERAMDLAPDYVSGAASGIRNQIRTILRQNKKNNLFTKAEEDVLRKIIGGTMATRAVRLVGDGIGRRLALMGGTVSGGPLGAAVGLGAGELAAQIGDSAAMRNAQRVTDLISTGAMNNLPSASPAVRRLVEEAVRRGGAVTAQ